MRTAFVSTALLLHAAAMAANPVPDAPHDALQAMGPHAAHVVDLWRLFLGVCAVVFGAVLAALVVALWRAPRSDEATPPDLSSLHRAELRPRRAVAAAIAGSALLLLVLIVASVFTDRALARMSLVGAVNLEVTANQWWWNVRYVDGGPADEFTTANEIHVPVGKPVVVELKASDVIHSLWVPNISGKKDLIPGRTAVMTLRADKPGIYRGQCAEFCGFQHAHMALLVVAQPQAEYDAWVQSQRAPAPEPTDAKAQRGKSLFQSVSCAMCHNVQGTQARGKRAPDLTHLASRRTLAAGTLANTPENLASWIADPHRHKPGVTMPATPLSNDDLQALVAYLGSLR